MKKNGLLEKERKKKTKAETQAFASPAPALVRFPAAPGYRYDVKECPPRRKCGTGSNNWLLG